MLGYLFAGLLLPIFSKLIKDKDNVVPVSWLSFKLIFLLSAIIGISIWIYKSDILSWRYGIVNYELDHSSETFGWLMVSFIAVSCNYIFGTLLTANENLKSLNILAIFGIIINISLNLILIPKSGSVGAAFASACTQFFVLIIQIFFIDYDIKDFFVTGWTVECPAHYFRSVNIFEILTDVSIK